MRITDKFVFFFGDIDVYSNWHMGTPFTMRGMDFLCGEQAMMYFKAQLMGDTVVMAKVMATNNPRDMKKLGRAIAPWNEQLWLVHRTPLMNEICFERTHQNQQMLVDLLLTGDRVIVEASPYDKIWGVGLGEYSPGIENPNLWIGLNLLGESHMDARQALNLLYP